MNVNDLNNKIRIELDLFGPSSWNKGWEKGGRDLREIHLLFSSQELYADVPRNRNPIDHTRLRIVKKGEKEPRGAGRSELKPNRIVLSIESVRKLSLKALFFELDRDKEMMVIGPKGRLSYQEQPIKREDNVDLLLPEEIEGGKSYRLQLTSNGSSLTASLIKEEEIEGKS